MALGCAASFPVASSTFGALRFAGPAWSRWEWFAACVTPRRGPAGKAVRAHHAASRLLQLSQLVPRFVASTGPVMVGAGGAGVGLETFLAGHALLVTEASTRVEDTAEWQRCGGLAGMAGLQAAALGLFYCLIVCGVAPVASGGRFEFVDWLPSHPSSHPCNHGLQAAAGRLADQALPARDSSEAYDQDRGAV